MGIPTNVWQQRIGMFSVPASRKSSLHSESEAAFSPTSFSVGIGTFTFLIIFSSVIIGTELLQYFQPTNSHELRSCGDIETNPGPATPDISADILEKLLAKDFNFELLQFNLKNKHVYQLILKKGGNTWKDFMQWLRALMPNSFPDNPPEDYHKKITQSCQLLKKKAQDKNKTPGKLAEWEEEDYKLPPTEGQPRPRKQDQPSSFDIHEAKLENQRLTQENAQLRQEKEELKKKMSS